LGTLFDAADPHPLTLVGLVGFRGVGLFESDPADVGDVSFYNEACLDISGSARVSGMAVAENYPFDINGNGVFEAEEHRDFLVVTHLAAGVLILDATNRDALTPVGWVRLPGQSGEVAVDPNRRLLYVSGLGGGLYVIDFDEIPSLAPHDANSDGLDDRLLETIPLAGNTNSATLVAPELGIAFAGGLDRGLTAIGIGAPWLVVLGPDGEGGWVPITRLAPLGVPTTLLDGRELPAVFRVMVALPGMVGSEFRLDVVSLFPGGLPIRGDRHPATPPPALTGAEGLLLRRLADQPWQPGYQTYLSDPVVTFADLRAAREYVRTGGEATLCPSDRCDAEAAGVPVGARELLSGDSIAIRFQPSTRQTLAAVYPSAILDRAEAKLATVRWETSPAVRQEPALSPSLGNGDAAPGTLLHSGEYAHTVTDLAVRGRGIDVAFTRTYRSQTVGSGPLGPGWELGYSVRLRELPNGDVEYFDGTGRRETFEWKGDRYDSPLGVFAELSRSASGWLLLDAQLNRQRFDRWGRLVSLSDAVKDSAETGNEIVFRYSLAGHLLEVIDDLGRSYALAYDSEGRLTSITDFTGRIVSYAYDSESRLATVTSPAVTIGESTFPGGLTTTYVYATVPAGADLATSLNTRDNLVAITDPRGVTWLELDYTDADGDGRADEATGQTWGGDPLSIAYDFENRTTTVTDRRGTPWIYQHDEKGRPTGLQDPSGGTSSWEYHPVGGILTLEVLPSGLRGETDPLPEGEPRERGRIEAHRILPVAGGDLNGSSSELKTEIVEYQAKVNLPNQVRNPRGTSVLIARNKAGLPTRVTEAFSSDDAAVTRFEYNAFGQLLREERLDSGGDLVTEHRYAESGTAAGLLERTIVDPGGLALTNRYERDARGNTVAVIDPRGVRHEFVYNELDWLVEETVAASGSADGAPALGYSTQYLYDETGAVVEVRRSFGESGTEFTREQIDYGPLGEVIAVRREVTPGAGDWLVEERSYDPNRNLVEVRAPEGRVTRFAYDGRNLVTAITRGAGTTDEQVELIAYDADGRPTQRTDARGNPWTTTYDAYGRVQEEIDPLGNRTASEYDNGGNPVRVAVFDPGRGILAQRTTDYDALARPVAATAWLWQYPEPAPAEPPQAPPPEATQLTRSVVYDDLSRPVTVTDRRGSTTSFEYDSAGRLAATEDALDNRTEYERDALGNPVVERTIERLPGGGTHQVAIGYGYDARGRRVRATDALGNISQVHFDARGNVLREIDAEGHLTVHSYDGLDRLLLSVRPGNLSTSFEYDAASRRTALVDALGNRTEWTYDVLDRATRVDYPDATSELLSYDPNGNLTERIDARSVVIDQQYDAADRLVARSILLLPGVEGVTSETFTLDGLGRTLEETAGGLVSRYRYDSLSRLLREETAGLAFGYTHDAEGNVVTVSTPAGKLIHRTPDALGRTALIEHDAGASPRLQKADYGFRGTDLIAESSLGGAVGSTYHYDPARRPVRRRFLDTNGDSPLDESVSWTPRGLRSGASRADQNGTGFAYATDPAGRLIGAQRTRGGAPVDTSPIPGLPAAHTFVLDRADNVLSQSQAEACGADTVALPLDGSGRNRPGSAGGLPLSWDAAGNLVARGDLQVVYDYRNRPVRVIDDGAEVARYEYDAAGRRVRRHAGGEVETTAWSGWQPVEVYVDGVLKTRRTYGLGLDEVVSLEIDLTGDGAPDQEYLPLYDHTGSLALLADTDGRPVEAYEYSPYGERWALVDSTPPAVEQVRVVGQEIWIEVSEGVLLDHLREALDAGEVALTNLGLGSVELIADQPVTDGREAGRRIVLRAADPDDPARPEAGQNVRLTVAAGALRDTFGNEDSAGLDLTFPWPAAGAMVEDATRPRVTQLCLKPGGALELTLSEEPDTAALDGVFQLDGTPLAWTLGTDRYSLTSSAPVAPGTHTLTLNMGPLDLAGLGLAEGFAETFTVTTGGAGAVLYSAPAPGLTTASAVGNPLGFHGLVHDPETGWIFARNRYLDPQLARFTAVDPLGYADSVSLYQYALANPVDHSDPLGLLVGHRALLQQDRFLHIIQSIPGDQQKQVFEAHTWAATYGIAASASAVGGPIGWAGVAGFAVIAAEQRYEQLVEWEARPDDATLWRAAYLGVTDVAIIGPAQELWTGVDRVTGEPLSGWGTTARVLELLPVGRNLLKGRGPLRAPDVGAMRPGERMFANLPAEGIAGDNAGILLRSRVPGGGGGGGVTRVGRWMSRQEFGIMLSTERVVEGAGGRTYVIRPPNPASYTGARPGSVYAEFDVPTNVLHPASKPDWAVIPGPNVTTRIYGPPPAEMPPATCIVCVIGQ
jgi:RHS repeat-associated protein